MEEASDETCGDEQALCEVLQTQVRSLERQELTQMRQGAVLQRKFDALEQQLRDARQQHQARLSNAAQRSHKRREARSSESLRCLSHAARVLEAELQTRWDEAARREQELAQRVRRGGARRVELQGDLGLWRRCGRGLLRRARPEPEPVLEDGPPQAEVEALRQGRLGLEQRLPELERITEAARQRQQQLYVQAEGLAASLCEAEAATLVARERQVSARRRESELGGAELQVPPPAEESEPTEELGRLRRRLQEQAGGCGVCLSAMPGWRHNTRLALGSPRAAKDAVPSTSRSPGSQCFSSSRSLCGAASACTWLCSTAG